MVSIEPSGPAEAERASYILVMAQGIAAHFGDDSVVMATRQMELCVTGSPMAETWTEIVAALLQPTVRPV
jgi:hypothetical protein